MMDTLRRIACALFSISALTSASSRSVASRFSSAASLVVASESLSRASLNFSSVASDLIFHTFTSSMAVMSLRVAVVISTSFLSASFCTSRSFCSSTASFARLCDRRSSVASDLTFQIFTSSMVVVSLRCTARDSVSIVTRRWCYAPPSSRPPCPRAEA